MKKILLFTIIIGLIVTISTAKEISTEQKITGLYIAFFKRAPDISGLEYWKNMNDKALQEAKDPSTVLKDLSKGFAAHEVFTSTYSGLTNMEFVEAIYKNTLGKSGDSSGIAYWTGVLNSGISRSDMVADFIDTSLSTDLTTENYPTLSQDELTIAQKRQDLISNKVSVAIDFDNKLGTKTNITNLSSVEDDTAYIASMLIVQGVTEDSATLSKAKSYLSSIYGNPNAIAKINDEFKWLNDIKVNTGETKHVLTQHLLGLSQPIIQM